MSRPTIFDVAKVAGVSIKTVSRVVNREPNVRASTGNASKMRSPCSNTGQTNPRETWRATART